MHDVLLVNKDIHLGFKSDLLPYKTFQYLDIQYGLSTFT